MNRPVPSVTEIAWAAGFLDGEGWFGASVQEMAYRPLGSVRYRVTVAASQNRETPLLKFQTWFGGAIRINKKTPAHLKPVLKWEVRTLESVVAVIDRIEPFLVVKGEEALAVRRFALHVKMGKRCCLSEEEHALRQAMVADVREIRRVS